MCKRLSHMHDGRPACAVRELPLGGGRPRLALRARGPSNETGENRSEEMEGDRTEEEARGRTGQNKRKETDGDGERVKKRDGTAAAQRREEWKTRGERERRSGGRQRHPERGRISRTT